MAACAKCDENLINHLLLAPRFLGEVLHARGEKRLEVRTELAVQRRAGKKKLLGKPQLPVIPGTKLVQRRLLKPIAWIAFG